MVISTVHVYTSDDATVPDLVRVTHRVMCCRYASDIFITLLDKNQEVSLLCEAPLRLLP
jgi:hypothetical protein